MCILPCKQRMTERVTFLCFHLSEICSALHLMVIGKSAMSLVVTMSVLCPDPSLYGFYRIPGLCCHKPGLLTVHMSTMLSRRYGHRICLLHHNQWLHSAPSMGFPHSLQSAGSECSPPTHHSTCHISTSQRAEFMTQV